jgi:hypothetical protein
MSICDQAMGEDREGTTNHQDAIVGVTSCSCRHERIDGVLSIVGDLDLVSERKEISMLSALVVQVSEITVGEREEDGLR